MVQQHHVQQIPHILQLAHIPDAAQHRQQLVCTCKCYLRLCRGRPGGLLLPTLSLRSCRLCCCWGSLLALSSSRLRCSICRSSGGTFRLHGGSPCSALCFCRVCGGRSASLCHLHIPTSLRISSGRGCCCCCISGGCSGGRRGTFRLRLALACLGGSFGSSAGSLLCSTALGLFFLDVLGAHKVHLSAVILHLDHRHAHIILRLSLHAAWGRASLCATHARLSGLGFVGAQDHKVRHPLICFRGCTTRALLESGLPLLLLLL
mmetsp:Transcript_16981/g.46978  ORF Transcript_16981/g.46978 Transcript_16981/m.46978 type:complete len:262 (+) Transcript_16981:1092-1877(+)